MKCSKCGSNNVSITEDTYVEEKGSSVVINILLCLFTCGLWLVWLVAKALSGKSKKSIIRKRKCAICQDCGHTFYL